MKSTTLLMLLPFVCLFVVFNVAAEAAGYPDRPIEMIIPFEPGSGTDLIGRLAADLAEKNIGVKINITNKPGGAGATGYTFLKNSRPDGYTIGLGTSTLVSHKAFGKLSFDHHDVSVISVFQSSPNMLCVPTNSPYKTLEDFINAAKKQPGKISWACGSGNTLTTSLGFFHQAGIELKVIPSGGGGVQPIIQASGGHVDTVFTSMLEAKSQIDAGLLRPIAINANERLNFFPDIPTFEELGYRLQSPNVRLIIAPLGVEKEKLEILNLAFKKAFATKKFHDFVDATGGVVLDASFDDARNILDEQQIMFEEAARLN